jgi:hypothetical protein
MNIPPDDGTGDPQASLPGPGAAIDPGAAMDPSMALTSKSSKTPLVAVGVLLVGGIGYFAFSSMKQRDERKMQAAFMEGFQRLEKEDVGKFWACVLGPNVDPGMIPDNLALAARIEGAFGMDVKSYPTKVREECTPKAIDAKHRVETLEGPSIYKEAMAKYAKGLGDLAHELDEWTKIAPAMIAERAVGKKVAEDGAAWHAFGGGKPGNDVVAYDRFLHCAVPGVDKMKDGQALVEYLFNQCKNPAYAVRIDTECGKEVTADVPGAPTPGFKQVVTKLAGDDRELSAFDDCLRKARKGKKRDDLAGVGRAFVGYMDAGHEVRKIGHEALKE